MKPYHITEEIENSYDSIYIRVIVGKLAKGFNSMGYRYYSYERSFAKFVYPPNWLSRKILGQTYEGRCSAAMKSLVAKANKYIEKSAETDKVVNELLSK